MRFPPSLIERIRSHFLMSEVVGKRVPLKKHGREYQAPCPFHNEKTPSFTVNDEKGFFHCFGCGAHGDAISFVHKFDRVSYGEAVETLAREAGIEIEKPTPAQMKKLEQEKTLYDVLEAACAWFEKQLNSTSGIIAKDYVEGRGLRNYTIQKFRIGYAPDSRTALHQHLNQLGFSQKLQEEAGLIITSQGSGAYDRFRGRVMFPIRNPSGKVVAFGGRLIASGTAAKNLPKYLNSPETSLFKKGEMLYNLDLAKAPARAVDMLVVMEGYMDVVMSAQCGVAYAAATLGTAVTPEHLRILWQVSKEPIMCLDGDAAGQRAMLRAAEVALPLLKPSYSLRFALLPKGEDPDSFIQKQGKESFDKLMVSSRRLSQILWDDMLAPKYDLNLPEGRAALEDEYTKLSVKITDATVRQHYQNHFKKCLWESGSRKKGAVAKATVRPEVGQMMAQANYSAVEKLVQRLFAIVLEMPSLLHKSHVEDIISHLDIRSSRLENMRGVLLAAAHNPILEDVISKENLQRYIQEKILVDDFSDFTSEIAGASAKALTELGEYAANQLWQETMLAYEVAHLEYEYSEIINRADGFSKEEDFTRFLALQNSLREARARRTFAPMGSDADAG